MIKYPSNDRTPIKIKHLVNITRKFTYHYNVNEDTLSVEGEVIKSELYNKNVKSSIHSNDLFISSMVMGTDRYHYTMNRNCEFEGEMLTKKINVTGF